jgi:hypothetical protein
MRALTYVLLFVASVGSFAVACGDRTGLLVDGTLEPDSGADAFVQQDAGKDAHDARAPEDALPPIDAITPLDVTPLICTDAGATQIYVITEQNILYSFYPPTLAFEQIGTIACPTVGTTTNGPPEPFSMAVDNRGVAYVVFDDGELFQVSTANASCVATTFTQDQDGFCDFGMGYSGDMTDAGETLYVAADPALDNNCPGAGVDQATLASVDPNLRVHPIGPFTGASVVGAELTGTGAGQLFAFYSHVANTDPDSYIGQIDKTTGAVTAESVLTGVSQGDGWAFAFWGGDFYAFVSATGSGFSDVWRYRPSDQSVMHLLTMQNVIVGAGVSTCAPAQ